MVLFVMLGDSLHLQNPPVHIILLLYSKSSSSFGGIPSGVLGISKSSFTSWYPAEGERYFCRMLSFIINSSSSLQQKAKARKQILSFVTTYHPSVRNLKNIPIQNWDLIQNQPLLNTIFKNPHTEEVNSLIDMFVKAKL